MSRDHDETTQSQDLLAPRHRSSKGSNCFPVTGIRFYNAVPLAIRNLPRPQVLTHCSVLALKASTIYVGLI